MMNVSFDLEYHLELIRKAEIERDEISAQIETLKDTVKKYLDEKGLEYARAGKYSVSWKEFERQQFDTKNFEADHEDLYKAYSDVQKIRRFVVR